jgi:uncharacterized membrane-anchored protein
MLGGGLVVVLLGGLLGCVIVAAIVFLLIYGYVARDLQKARRAAAVAIVLAILSIIVSLPFWILVVSDRSTMGDKLDLLGGDAPILVPVVLEAAAFVASIWVYIRARRRARAEAEAVHE